MRVKFSILALILSISFITNAQIVFNNTYDIDSLFNSFNSQIEFENGDFIVGDQAFNSDNSYYVSYISRINEFGDVVWKKKIDIFQGSVDVIGEIKQYNNYIYIVGAGRDTTINGWNAYLLKMSLDGDSLYSKIFTDTLVSTGSKLIIKNDQLYILQWTAAQIPFTDTDIRILKTDTNGNIIDTWEYGANYIDGAQDFKQTKDGGFILAGNSRSYTADNNSDLFFLKIDSLGNVEWQKNYGSAYDETTRPHNFLTITQEGGYLMIGEEIIYTPSFFQRLVVLKVDSLGNQMWRKNMELMEQTYALSMREWQDGTIIITGSVANYDTIIPLFNSVKSYLIKLSADGQTEIWRRYFSKNWLESDEYVHGMMLTSDGGILTTGWVSAISATNNDAWVVKFDSCGYTVGDVPAPLVLVDSMYKNKVFLSEQSENYCTGTIDWGDGTALEAFYAYENNLPLAVKQLEHIYSEIGNFTIKTTILAGEEYRSYEVDITIKDIGVGINPIATKGGSLSLFPNPANDYVIVENRDSFLQRIRKYSDDGVFKMHIFDLNGKQVKRIDLNAKLYQQKIDVAALNNGVYFVRFMLGEELIGTEKMVIAK